MAFSTQGVYRDIINLNTQFVSSTVNFWSDYFFNILFTKLKRKKIQLLQILNHGISITESCIITEDNIIFYFFNLFFIFIFRNNSVFKLYKSFQDRILVIVCIDRCRSRILQIVDGRFFVIPSS